MSSHSGNFLVLGHEQTFSADEVQRLHAMVVYLEAELKAKDEQILQLQENIPLMTHLKELFKKHFPSAGDVLENLGPEAHSPEAHQQLPVLFPPPQTLSPEPPAADPTANSETEESENDTPQSESRNGDSFVLLSVLKKMKAGSERSEAYQRDQRASVGGAGQNTQDKPGTLKKRYKGSGEDLRNEEMALDGLTPP